MYWSQGLERNCIMAAPAVGTLAFGARVIASRWARRRIYTRMVARGSSSTAARSGYRYRLAMSGGAYRYNKSYKLYHTKDAGKLRGLKTVKSHGMPRSALAHVSHGKGSLPRAGLRTGNKYRSEVKRTRAVRSSWLIRRRRRRNFA